MTLSKFQVMIRLKMIMPKRLYKFQILLLWRKMVHEIAIGCSGVYMMVTGKSLPHIESEISHTDICYSGWTTSAKLRQTLISFVARELNSTYMAALKDAALNFPTAEAIDSAIKKGFVRLDN